MKLWMGDARGRWEGNTLVVDTTNVRGARLTYIGDFYSDNAHIVERITFVDADTMNYEATVDDPTVFTRPWTMRVVAEAQAERRGVGNGVPRGERAAGQVAAENRHEAQIDRGPVTDRPLSHVARKRTGLSALRVNHD